MSKGNLFKRIDSFQQYSLRAIEKLEDTKVNPIILFIYMSLLLAIRDFFEQVIFSHSYRIPVFTHHLFFWIATFLSAAMLLSWIARSDLCATIHVVSAGIPIIVLPPLIDRFLFLRHVPYDYLQPAEFLPNLLTFLFNTEKAGIGIPIEILLIVSLSSYYVLLKTQSLWRSFFSALSIYLLMMIVATPKLFMPLPSGTIFIQFQDPHDLFSLNFFCLALVVGSLFIWRIDRNLPRALFHEWLSWRSLHFTLMSGAGFYFANGFAFLGFPDIVFFCSSIFVINLLWLSTVLLNNVYDLSIDEISNPNRPLPRGDVSTAEYFNLSIILAFVAFFLSMLSGAVVGMLVIVFVLSSLAYSAPPLRLRQHLFSTFFIGWGSVLAFLIGYWNRTKFKDISLSPLTTRILIVIFIALSIGSLTKDLKDYRGDAKNGVRNFFTMYGCQKGKRIVASLLCFSLLTPILLFQQSIDLAFFICTATFTSALFYVSEKVFFSFLGYGITCVYCAFRYLNLI